ncbi:DNA-binding protein, partial [Acinetobacter baumannii]
INVAYDTLSNPEKKAEYDQMLDHPQGFNGCGQGAAQGGFDGARFYRQGFTGGEQADVSGFEDLFGRFGAGFGGGQQQYQRQKRS